LRRGRVIAAAVNTRTRSKARRVRYRRPAGRSVVYPGTPAGRPAGREQGLAAARHGAVRWEERPCHAAPFARHQSHGRSIVKEPTTHSKPLLLLLLPASFLSLQSRPHHHRSVCPSVRPSAVRHSVGYLVNHLSPSLLSISVSPNYAVPQYRLLSMFIILCWCQQYVCISLQTGTIENGAHYAVNCAFACMLSTNSPRRRC